MKIETIQSVKELLNTAKKIAVIGHKNPDGDAIGSCLGLSFFLNSLGYDSKVVMPNDFPKFLKWIPGCESVLTYTKNAGHCTAIIDDADLIFTLDFNALDRVGDLQPLLEGAKCPFIMIDHHQQPADYAAATYSDVTMSSTAQMVYHFIDALDGLEHIDENIATQLYTGIMTDTGSFRFPATTAVTHRVIAHLIEAGAKNSEIHQNIYDTNSTDRLKLLGAALNNLNILSEFNTAFITISQNELDLNNYKKGDTEGFVNYALSIEGVKFAVIFIENHQEKIVKISFRSKGNFSVNEFARENYHGGGHTNAAGGRSEKSLSDTVSEFISILPRYKQALSHDS